MAACIALAQQIVSTAIAAAPSLQPGAHVTLRDFISEGVWNAANGDTHREAGKRFGTWQLDHQNILVRLGYDPGKRCMVYERR